MLTFLPVMPAAETATRGRALNLLCGAANDGGDLRAEVTLWGDAGGGWMPLETRAIHLRSGEHLHLYFTLPPEVFEAPFWGGAAPEELALRLDVERPGDGARGTLVCIE